MPTRGMERWLTQRLSAGLGATPGRARRVCANVDFPSRGRLIGDAVAAASGIDPDADPWLPERLVWPLLEVVDEALGEPWLARARRPPRRGRRAARPRSRAVRHLADLFDRYALHRPEMVARLGGGRGRAAGRPSCGGGCARGSASPSPAERLDARVRAPARRARTRRPAGAALAVRPHAAARRPPRRCCARSPTHRDVHLFLLHPSPALWERIAAGAPRSSRRADDPTARAARATGCSPPGARTRASCSSCSAPRRTSTTTTRSSTRAGTLLAAHPGRRPRGPRRAATTGRARRATAASRSTPATAAPARSRSLRDAILHLLADDPTLEPRDVIVMCPDIETFAPLIQATFGAGETSTTRTTSRPRSAPPDLRVRLADRSLRQTNPVLGVVARLLELAGQRLTASQVLDLADREPVRRRFRLDDDDLARLEEWVARRAASAGGSTPRTARRSSSTTLPTRHVARRAGPAAARRDDDRGRAAAVRRRAAARRRRERRDRPRRAASPSWSTGCRRAVDALDATAAGRRVGGGARRRRRRADRDARRATPGSAPSCSGCSTTSSREAGRPRRPSSRSTEVRALLADRLQGRPTRANFRTGHLTICTLVPMRSVPHRVVCLLGLDDGVVPAQGAARRRRPAARRPARRRARRAHRGPPAAARRADGRHRPADRHLHRQRRAHEPRRARRRCRSASCSTSSGRERRRPASAAAVRPAQLRRRRARAGRAAGASTASRSRARGR